MAHLLRATFVGTFVAVATLGACTLKTDGTGATSGPVGGQGMGGDAGEAGTGGAASEGGTGGVGGEGGAGGGIAGTGLGGSAGGGASGAGASGAGMSGGGAGGSAGASGAGGSAPVCGATGVIVDIVECEKYQDCTDLEPPSCPAGSVSCEIRCSNEESCLRAKIDCNGAIDCVVRCSGRRACRGADVVCGPGTCKVICGDETEEEDDTESCSGTGGDTMTVDCANTAGDCTICGVNDDNVTIGNTAACTGAGCTCGEIGSCN
jgi:hypothetical protein